MSQHQQPEPMNFDNRAGGALAERVEYVIAQVLQNMLDPNTKATTARKVTITISFKADEEREITTIAYDVAAKLAPLKSHLTAGFLGVKDGKPVMFEQQDPKQLHMQEQLLQARQAEAEKAGLSGGSGNVVNIATAQSSAGKEE